MVWWADVGWISGVQPRSSIIQQKNGGEKIRKNPSPSWMMIKAVLKAKQKVMHRRKGKFYTSHQQVMPSHFLRSRTSAATENKCHYGKFPPLSPAPFLTFISEQTSRGVEHLFGQIGPVVLAVSSPRILPTLRLLMRGNVG